MRVAVTTIIASAATIAACSSVPIGPAGQARDVAWDAGRPLAWNDFLGRVDASAAPDRVAMTAASLSWGYEYQIERDAESCVYWITGVRAKAIFNRRDSWVRPGHRNPDVLRHEQGHFDLTQIYKVILDERADELIGRRNPCEGNSLEAASKFTEASAAKLVQGLFDEVWHEYIAAQAAYDEHTRNGTSAEAQALWARSIQHALRVGYWQMPPVDPSRPVGLTGTPD